uniref:Alpha/beta hydrolase fold-3 domain-containing protein n=1 Tax=Oryza nivara TaxID=4536 RepID=A0A0E0GYA9_ORYNI
MGRRQSLGLELVVEEVRTAGAAAVALAAEAAEDSEEGRVVVANCGHSRGGGWQGRREQQRMARPWRSGTGAARSGAASPSRRGPTLLLDVTCPFVVRDSAGANIAHHVARRYALASTTFANFRLAGLIAIQPFFSGEERTPAELRLVGALIISVPRTDWLWYAFLPPGAAPCRIAMALPSSAAPAVSAAAAAPTVLVAFNNGANIGDLMMKWQMGKRADLGAGQRWSARRCRWRRKGPRSAPATAVMKK